MSTLSSNLQLPFLASGQAQKHVTVNESLLRLDALVQLAVISATTSAQPGSPADGQIYILPAGKTGAQWGAMANNALAHYRDGAWEAIAPREGWLAYAKDADQLLSFSGASWGPLFQSGVYTPTLTLVTNVDAATPLSCQYLRVGGIVSVSGRIDIDATAAAALTEVGVSLPFASDFASSNECSGTAACPGLLQAGAVLGDATNNRAGLRYIAQGTTTLGMFFNFTYRII